jgi:hypothetical protein
MTRLLKSRTATEPTGWKSMGEDQPRTCAGCGERLVLAHPEPLWFDTLHLESWHFGCKLVELRKQAA